MLHVSDVVLGIIAVLLGCLGASFAALLLLGSVASANDSPKQREENSTRAKRSKPHIGRSPPFW